MEKLDVKRLREEAVTEARRAFLAATTTRERHYARLELARAIREQGGDMPEEKITLPAPNPRPKLCPFCHTDLNESSCGHA